MTFRLSKLALSIMKLKFILIALLCLNFGCEKEKEIRLDPRDAVIGKYSGVKSKTVWDDEMNRPNLIVIGPVTAFISKSSDDDWIELRFDSITPYHFSFKFHNDTFNSYTHHGPSLVKSGDSLWFFHQPGLGPSWTIVDLVKVKKHLSVE